MRVRDRDMSRKDRCCRKWKEGREEDGRAELRGRTVSREEEEEVGGCGNLLSGSEANEV